MNPKGFAIWEDYGIISAQETPEPPEPSPAPAGEPEAPPPEEEPNEGVWKEDYEEIIEPDKSEEVEKVPKKKSHWLGIIAVVVIIAFLVIWTVLSPKVMGPVGRTYVDSNTYADLGNFTGVRSIWSGTTTWGVSVSGSSEIEAGAVAEYRVLITKVNESTGNFFFTGTSIVITNVSLYKSDGTYLANMVSKSSLGYGKEALVKYTYPAAGTYDLYITAKFTVYEVMRIGYFPLESVFVERVSLIPIEVSPEGSIAPM